MMIWILFIAALAECTPLSLRPIFKFDSDRIPEYMKTGICKDNKDINDINDNEDTKDLPCCKEAWKLFDILSGLDGKKGAQGAAFPFCDKDGFYEESQCKSYTYCYCVDKFGKIIEDKWKCSKNAHLFPSHFNNGF